MSDWRTNWIGSWDEYLFVKSFEINGPTGYNFLPSSRKGVGFLQIWFRLDDHLFIYFFGFDLEKDPSVWTCLIWDHLFGCVKMTGKGTWVRNLSIFWGAQLYKRYLNNLYARNLSYSGWWDCRDKMWCSSTRRPATFASVCTRSSAALKRPSLRWCLHTCQWIINTYSLKVIYGGQMMFRWSAVNSFDEFLTFSIHTHPDIDAVPCQNLFHSTASDTTSCPHVRATSTSSFAHPSVGFFRR